MDRDMLAPFNLYIAQKTVATQPWHSTFYVIAGPGVGKTHLVAARLAHLVLAQGLRPASQVILLSYTRAAVREMKARLASAAELLARPDLSRVTVQTLDQFAWQVHSAAGRAPPYGFDESIESATALLQTDPQAKAFVRELNHVIVDEAQDLLGRRNLFVQSILTQAGGGFTVLADPNQGIFDYILEEDGAPPNSSFENFLQWLDENYHLQPFRLQGSRRHVGPMRTLVKTAEARMNRGNAYTALYEMARGRHANTGVEGPIAMEDLPGELAPKTGTVAILTRNNGQALAVSTNLDEAGTAHHLVQRKEHVRTSAWVGCLLGLLPPRFEVADIHKVWPIFAPISPSASPETVFAHFQDIIGSFDDALDLRDVVDAAGEARLLPAEFTTEHNPNRVFVSTIHKAKGREFDEVILDVSDYLGHAAMDDPQQADAAGRVLYVGLTRARHSIRGLSMNVDLRLARKRWCQVATGGNGRRRLMVEITTEDLKDIQVPTADLLTTLHSQRERPLSMTAGPAPHGGRWPLVTEAGYALGHLSEACISELHAICDDLVRARPKRLCGIRSSTIAANVGYAGRGGRMEVTARPILRGLAIVEVDS